jgi:glutamine synthetase
MATKPKSEGSVEKVFKLIKDHGVRIVDMKFTDLVGQWQHFSTGRVFAAFRRFTKATCF